MTVIDSPPGTATVLSVALRPGITLAFDADAVRVDGAEPPFGVRLDGGVRAALVRLARGPVPRAELLAVAGSDRERLVRFLRRFSRLVAHGVAYGGRELVRLESTGAEPPPDPAPVPLGPASRVRLSRFALCRTRDDVLVGESPLSTVRVLLLDPAARAAVAALGSPGALTGLAVDLPRGALAELVGHLAAAGLVEVAGPDGAFATDTDPTMRQWDFHDQLMHSRVRSGRYDDPFGALYPHRGTIPPQPAVKPPPDGPEVPLYRPTWDELAARDPSLTAALEGRRSIRDYGPDPLTVRELGEFLYRVHRVRAHYAPTDETEDEAVSRPYPSGGRAYELELWLTVRRCAGLDPGVYYHDPVAHRLVLVNDVAADREAMLAVAARATGVPARPDVLVTMTSRFQRLSWKYRGIAYATTLRHTGVLYQTMYLVATAMGLAPCGLGNGDADLSARVLGLDRVRESSVGDFVLGSRAPGDTIGSGPDDVPPGWSLLNGADWPVRAARQLP